MQVTVLYCSMMRLHGSHLYSSTKTISVLLMVANFLDENPDILLQLCYHLYTENVIIFLYILFLDFQAGSFIGQVFTEALVLWFSMKETS